MTAYLSTVRDHYQAAIPDTVALLAGIEGLIGTADGAVSAERLARLDQFHLGGLAATAELARRVAVTKGLRVLDAGSGLGGPSRWLAEHCGADVTGVDLAPAFVAVSEMLARKAGLSGRVGYHAGSITALPFADGSFDLVWTQHVVMNIPDRAGLYRELRRVLKRGGRLAFYDPYLPDQGEPPLYPTPWAERAEASTLLRRDETIEALTGASFRVDLWDDVTSEAAGWAASQQQLIHQGEGTSGDAALTLGLVLGPRMREMAMNFQRNLQERRVQLVMGVCTAM